MHRALVCTALIALAGCARHEESRVRKVAAHIDGITCPTCVPPLQQSLQHQFDKATEVEVSDTLHTATLRFDPQQAFSTSAFRNAVERVRMRLVDMRIDACGHVEEQDGARWFVAGADRYRVEGDTTAPVKTPICILGSLDVTRTPASLTILSYGDQTRESASAPPAPTAASSTADAVPPPQGFGGDFTLTDQDGRPFNLHDERGKVVLLFFGYTSCPDMCPTTMSRIATALAPLGGTASQVRTVFVSVDPRRDSPAVLKKYVGSFTPPLIGLTGEAVDIAGVASQYHASYQLVDTGTPNYVINHTTAIFLIDKAGNLRQYFAYDEKPETIGAAVKALAGD